MARGGPGGGALAAAHVTGRRHAAARPLADRPRRPDRQGREVARPGLAGLRRARRRGRRDHRPAPGGGADGPVRPGVGSPGGRERVRDQGHRAGDDGPVLLTPPGDHRRRARARRAVRGAVRPRTVAAGTGAARAGVQLRHAQGQGRRAGPGAGARGLGGPAGTDARRAARVRGPVSLARRRPPRRRSRSPARRRRRTRPRGPAGPGTGAAGKVRMDPGKPGQAPGPDPAPHRAEPGSRGQAAGGNRRTDPALRVQPGLVPGGPRPGRPADQPGPRGRPQRVPAPRRAPATPPARSCRWRNAWPRRRRP